MKNDAVICLLDNNRLCVLLETSIQAILNISEFDFCLNPQAGYVNWEVQSDKTKQVTFSI